MVINFNEQPVCPLDTDSHLYILNKFDDYTGETSVIKLYIEQMVCVEIYQSRFEIFDISLLEITKDIKGDKKLTVQQSTTPVSNMQLFGIEPSPRDSKDSAMRKKSLSEKRKMLKSRLSAPTQERIKELS